MHPVHPTQRPSDVAHMVAPTQDEEQCATTARTAIEARTHPLRVARTHLILTAGSHFSTTARALLDPEQLEREMRAPKDGVERRGAAVGALGTQQQPED